MIEIAALKKSFGAVMAVDGVSFTALDGQVTALLGPNGAGKTTTLRMLAGMIKADSGQALISGVDAQTNPIAARRQLALLSDARGLYQRLTAEENIRYYADLHGVSRSVTTSRIAELATALEMNDILKRKTEGFSSGERTKVAIARAMIHYPQNVVLDEPTNGLDVMTTRGLRKLIRQLKEQGRCVVFSSHVMHEVAQLADRIVVIAHGRVVADGEPEALLALTERSTLEEAFMALAGLDELSGATA